MDKIKGKDEKKVEPQIESSFYVPLDMAAIINEADNYVQSGESSRVDALKDVFAWMRGFVNGWYGWPNDGKGTMFDFLALLKAKYDGCKICAFKPEDMDTVVVGGKATIKANRIYKNLAWSLTGKTWNKGFAERRGVTAMTYDEEMDALKFIKKHFFVIYPHDRKYKSMLDNCLFMYEKFGIDIFLWDPFNEVELPNNERGDERLVAVFRDVKKFAMETNTSFNIVSHAKSMMDVKEKEGPKKGQFKVVTQFMQLGGAAWDIKMDGQFSIHRPYRHDNPRDPRVHFYNLKQKQSEVVGVERGVCEDVVFDPNQKGYYFDGINPMSGHKIEKKEPQPQQEPQGNFFGGKKTAGKRKSEPPKDFTAPIETITDTPF